MNIKTKYKINDFVYPIRMGGYEKYVKCKTCDGVGYVLISNTQRSLNCPDCYGRGGNREWQREKWNVLIKDASKIGKIATELYRKDKSDKNRIVYMIDNTGIGSGTLWNETDLFIDINDAQTECEIRNKSNLKGELPQVRVQGGKQ